MADNNMDQLMAALGMLQRGNQFASEPERQRQAREHDNQLKQQYETAKLQQQEQAQTEAQKRAIEQAEALQKKHPGMGVEISKEGASIKPNPIMATYDMKQQMQDQKNAENYSKRLEKINDFSGTLQELEKLTNRDGKGGILTNPNAKLISAGKAVSLIPDNAMGVAEATGLAPKGAAEERKSLARIKNEYAFAKSGARANPALIAMEKEAMGYMASGDPALLAKGVRVLGRNMQSHVKTIKAGYKPQVQELVHSQMGDPEDAYSSIYDDNKARMIARQQQPQAQSMANQPTPMGTPKPGIGDTLKGFLTKTTAQPSAPASPSGPMRVRHRASGQTGTIDASEYDPSQYEQIQ